MTTLCPHCGTNNRSGSNFCNNCGTELRDTGSSSAELPAVGPAQATVDSIDDPSDESAENFVSEQEDEAEADQNLRPLFDLGLASVDQPWLGPPGAAAEPSAIIPEEESAPFTGEGERPDGYGRRLVAGVQGLLDPLNISGGDEALPRVRSQRPTPMLTIEESERVRRVMGEAPAPAQQMRIPDPSRFPRLRIPWLFWLIGLAVAIPAFGLVSTPGGGPSVWPGVERAYATVETVPIGAHVLVYFAYDPATSGEMDLLAVPALRHLLERRANPTFVTLSPNGPATVRRTVREVLSGMLAEDDIEIALRRITARTIYLSGGAAVLPLVGAAPEKAPRPAIGGRMAELPPPSLAVLMAPRSEDVQHWLELVQPLDGIPAVAYTAAGVDPMVRPYLESGQLQGLVSGFDGAEAYATLVGKSKMTTERWQVHIVAQNWGHAALFLVLLLGNVAGYLRRNRDET